MTLGWNRTHILEKNSVKYLVSSGLTFVKELEDVPVVNHPSYREYTPCVWMDAPDCFQLLGLFVRLKNPLNPVCVWHCVLDCEQRLFVLKSLEHSDIVLMNCVFQHKSFMILWSFVLNSLTTEYLCWTVDIKAGHSISHPIQYFHIKGLCSFIWQNISPKSCSAEKPLVSPQSFADLLVPLPVWSLPAGVCVSCAGSQSNPIPPVLQALSPHHSATSLIFILSANFISNDFFVFLHIRDKT